VSARSRSGTDGAKNPREIAHGVLFLVADDAMFFTGSTITVNGGQYMT
jgi:acetoacetyl-CoA reductase